MMSAEAEIYRSLQQHLDRQAVGFPAVPSGADLQLLQRLFTPEEARLALHLSYKPTPAERIFAQAAAHFSSEQATQLLESMGRKGAIGWKQKDGVDHGYVMPLVVGMYEAQDGQPTPEFLADVFAYMSALEYGRSFLSVKPSQMRTIPINQSIPVDHSVATYDQIRAIVQAARGPFVVLPCICRVGKTAKGKACTQTNRAETCLGFDDAAAMILRRKRGREITREEGLAILQQNEADGLVLQPANAQQPEFVCSCCGCCCGMLAVQKSLPYPVRFWTSNYQTSVDKAACVGCGKCVQRCQVNAVTLAEPANQAQINPNRCIGCGLCVPTCPTGAMRLAKKDPATVPPPDEEALYDTIMANKKDGWKHLRALLRP